MRALFLFSLLVLYVVVIEFASGSAVCSAHTNTLCAGELIVPTCDSCSLDLLESQNMIHCGISNTSWVNGTGGSYKCFPPGARFALSATYFVEDPPGSVLHACDPSQCCCMTGGVKVVRSLSSLKITIQASVIGQCPNGTSQISQTYPISSGGESYAFVQNLFGVGPYLIYGDDEKLDFRYVNNPHCSSFTYNRGPGAAAVAVIIVACIVGFLGTSLLIHYIGKRHCCKKDDGYAEV